MRSRLGVSTVSEISVDILSLSTPPLPPLKRSQPLLFHAQQLPAHMCYLLAGQQPSPWYSRDASYCLVGSDHARYPRTYCTALALQRSEIFEWSGRALSSGSSHTYAANSHINTALGFPAGSLADGSAGHVAASGMAVHGSPAAAQSTTDAGGSSGGMLLQLLPFKLFYAHLLAEAGKVSEAVQYCQVCATWVSTRNHTHTHF